MAGQIAEAYVQIIPTTDGIASRIAKGLGDNGASGGKTFASRFIGAAGGVIGTFAKVTGAALAAGAGAVATLTTSAVRGYADYEQLAGGVQKLFGDASDQMMTYAQNAYMSAGMSANQYMAQSTSFAAALIQSYGGDTARAASQADKAMRAISDNFNTFGGDIANVQNAFQGFAKQNYTMLDNLKLGYGGTQSEMQRLVADANAYAKSIGQAGNLSIKNFGDIVEAIDLIQQKQNIAGTTAREAATTITGSWMMTKAAWSNLITAFGDKNADLSVYFDALTTSAETTFRNILPVAEQALTGIGEVVANLAPVIGEKLPVLMSDVLPGFLNAAGSLVSSISTALPDMIGPITDSIIAAAPQIVESGIALFASLATGMITAIPQIVAALPAIWESVKTGFSAAWPQMKEAGLQLIQMVGEGITAAAGWIGAQASAIWNSIKTSASDAWNNMKSQASTTWGAITSSISAAWGNIKLGVSNGVNAVKSTVSSVFSSVNGTVSGIWNGIKSTISSVMDGIKSKIQSAVNTIKNVFNFSWSLPSLKLPHFTVSGKFSLNPPAAPSFGISWYAKGAVLNGATIFGLSGNKLLGGGEAGPEAVAPVNVLQRYIRDAMKAESFEASVSISSAAITEDHSELISLVRDLSQKIDRLRVYIDGDTLVGRITDRMNSALGMRSTMDERGLA